MNKLLTAQYVHGVWVQDLISESLQLPTTKFLLACLLVQHVTLIQEACIVIKVVIKLQNEVDKKNIYGNKEYA